MIKKIKLHKVTNKERVFRFIESCKGKVASYTQIQKFIYEYNNPEKTFHGFANRGYWSTNLVPFTGFLYNDVGYGKLVRRLRSGKYVYSVQRPLMYKKHYKFAEDITKKAKITKTIVEQFKIGDKVKIITSNGGVFGSSAKYGEIVTINEIMAYRYEYKANEISVSIKRGGRESYTQIILSSEVELVSMKYEIGTLVEIIANTNNHNFIFGEVVRITDNEDYEDHGYRCEYLNGSDWWWVKASDLKLSFLSEESKPKKIEKPKVMPTKQMLLKEDQFIVDKSFILEAHKAACTEWKTKLEKKYPKVFEKPVTYKIGQTFVDISCDSKYLLAKVDSSNKVNMISLSSGQNFSYPYEVKDVNAITQEELFKLADSDFRLVK